MQFFALNAAHEGFFFLKAISMMVTKSSAKQII